MSPKLLSCICLAIIVIDCIQATVSNDTLRHFTRIRRSDSCGDCGRGNGQAGNPLIISGEVVRPPNKYPWVVGLIGKEEKKTFCGSSLISNTFILTAAHCLRVKDKITDTLGDGWCQTEKGRKKCLMDPSEFEVQFLDDTRGAVEQTYTLPDFKPHKPQEKDIGLIRLKEPITCDEYKRPICLPERNRPVKQDVGQNMIITGWGVMQSDTFDSSDELREIQIMVMNVEDCAAYGGAAKEKLAYCATTRGKGSPCFGDSGGSLFTPKGGQNIVYGIASAVFSETCEANKPTLFTAVAAYMDWVSETMGQQ